MLGIQEMTVCSYLRSASSAIDQPGHCIICKFQEEAIASSCLLLATPMHRLKMSVYRKFPWVPWESHENGKYYSSSVGMGKRTGMA